MRKFTLKDAELIKEDGKYYITAKYDLETDYDIREFTVERVPLPLNNEARIDHMPDEELWFDNNPRMHIYKRTIVDLGYGKIMVPNEGRIFIKEEIIKGKTQELTLEEIEQKLGYKVKIVTKKGKK